MSKVWLLRYVKLFVILGIPLLGFVYAYQFTGQARATEEIVPFKPFKTPNSTYFAAGKRDQNFKLDLNAPITVVNYWATWCPPCVEEFPAMLELERQLKGSGVQFVFVSIDEKWENVEKFVHTYLRDKFPEHLMWDPQRNAAAQWGSVKFPESYVVRRDGWVVEKIIGLQMWTRPLVVKYFTDLGKKFQDLQPTTAASVHTEQFLRGLKSLPLAIVPSAYAADSKDNALGTAPVIHDEDQKNLDKLRKNIETATQNLQKAEAAQKEEERNLKEQKVVYERRQKDQSDAQSDQSKIQGKVTEVQSVIKRTQDSMVTEKTEKKKVEGEIEDIRKRISDLEKKLDRSKDDLTQANKSLNSRVQNIETLEKSEDSSKEELGSLKGQSDKADSLVKDRKSSTNKAESEIKKREKRLGEIQGEVAKAKKSLDEQKTKLDEFEKLLRK